MSKVADARVSRRYWILRGIGLGWAEARKASAAAQSFVECLRAHGRDPAEHGDLCARLPNGRPVLHTPRAIQRRANYASLRQRGVSVDLALRLAKSPGRARDALRRLEQGLPLRQER